jgi:hypothetical protein
MAYARLPLLLPGYHAQTVLFYLLQESREEERSMWPQAWRGGLCRRPHGFEGWTSLHSTPGGTSFVGIACGDAPTGWDFASGRWGSVGECAVQFCNITELEYRGTREVECRRDLIRFCYQYSIKYATSTRKVLQGTLQALR